MRRELTSQATTTYRSIVAARAPQQSGANRMSMRGLIEATSVAVIGHRPAITSAHLKVAQHSRTTRQGGSRPASSATVTTAGCLRTRQSKSRHTDNGVPQLRPAVAITSRGRPVPSRSHTAVIAAVALLVRPRRYTAAFAFLVAAAGTAAVVVYRYVAVGAMVRSRTCTTRTGPRRRRR